MPASLHTSGFDTLDSPRRAFAISSESVAVLRPRAWLAAAVVDPFRAGSITGGAGRQSSWWAVELVKLECSFLAGDHSGGRAQHGVEVVALAEVSGQDPSVLQVADAVLDADPLQCVSPAFGLVCRSDGGQDRQLALQPGPGAE